MQTELRVTNGASVLEDETTATSMLVKHDNRSATQTSNQQKDAVYYDRHTDILNLPKARLNVAGGIFRKLATNGEVVSATPFERVRGLWIKKTRHLVRAITTSAAFAGVATLCKTGLESAGWGWCGAIVFGGLALAALGNTKKHTIVLDTDHGHIEFPCADPIVNAEAFLMSVRQRMADWRSDG